MAAKNVGRNHLDVGTSVINLASLYQAQDQRAEAALNEAGQTREAETEELWLAERNRARDAEPWGRERLAIARKLHGD